MNYKPNLDLLRAIAILLVLFDHFMLALHCGRIGSWNPAWMGVFGVYLFFVHTCLVLMWSLQRKPHTLDFYIRRVFRIYPLAAVATLAIVLLHLPFSSDPHHMFTYYTGTVKGIASNLLLIQNIARGGGYALGVMWSLPLEVDMYVLLPVLYFFVRRNFSLWPLLLMWGLACGLARPYAADGNTFITVIPCFIPGVMAYVMFERTKPKLQAWMLPFFVVALLIFFMHFCAVWASWPICLTLGLGLPLFRQIRWPVLKRVSHEIAKYSYSLYLLHIFALGTASYLLQGHSRWLQLPLALSMMLLLSFAGYHLVEKPMIDLGARLAARAEVRYEQRGLADSL